MTDFATRCRMAQECLPDAEYRRMLARLHDDMQAAIAAPPALTLTDERILFLWDTHVGTPTLKWPFVDADKIDFARAVLAAAQPAPTEQEKL